MYVYHFVFYLHIYLSFYIYFENFHLPRSLCIYINIYVSIYLYIYLSLYLSVNLFKNLSSFSSLSLYRISVLFVLLLILSPIYSTGVATGTLPRRPPHLWEVKNHDSQGELSPRTPLPEKYKNNVTPIPSLILLQALYATTFN